jgi:hypothetical protein
MLVAMKKAKNNKDKQDNIDLDKDRVDDDANLTTLEGGVSSKLPQLSSHSQRSGEATSAQPKAIDDKKA